MTDLTTDTLAKLRAEMDAIRARTVPTPAQILARRLHLSLAREHVRKAVAWYRQAREDAWQLNSDQIDALRDWASDAKIEARAHIAAALR